MILTVTEWTPEAIAAEEAWRSARRELGMCPDSGLSLVACRTSICDCWWTPTQEPAESGQPWHPGATQTPSPAPRAPKPLNDAQTATQKAAHP